MKCKSQNTKYTGRMHAGLRSRSTTKYKIHDDNELQSTQSKAYIQIQTIQMQTQISFRRPMFSVLSVQYPATSPVFTRYSMLQHKSDDDISMMLKYDDSVSLFIVQDEIDNGQIPRQLISVRENWSLTLLVGWRSGQNVTLNFHSFFSFDFLQGVVPGFDLPQLVELLWIHWSKIQNHH